MKPLIKVNNDNYDYEIEKIINNLLGVIYSRCPLCGYNEGKNIDNNKFSTCLKTESYDIKMPIYLSLVLDVEISENSIINFKELLKHQNYWNKILKKSFKLSNKRYEIYNIINYPVNNHYTCCIKYDDYDKNYYYYDDTLNNGYLTILKNNTEDDLKEIKKNNIYIIMFKEI